MTLNTRWLEQELEYTGPELRPHFLLTQLKLKGNALAAFVGPCRVRTEHLVDWEDRMVEDRIEARSMLHLLGEFFGAGLQESVLRQRLIVATLQQLLMEKLRAQTDRPVEVRRDGDDLFVLGRKLTVSIVTASPVSCLFHLGINVDPQGAPVPAVGLKELGVDPRQLAQDLLERVRVEWDSIHWATTKVRPV